MEFIVIAMGWFYKCKHIYIVVWFNIQNICPKIYHYPVIVVKPIINTSSYNNIIINHYNI